MNMFRDISFVFGVLVVVIVAYYFNYAGFSYIEAMTDPETNKDGGGDIVDVVSIAKKQTESTKTAISSLNIKEQRAHYRVSACAAHSSGHSPEMYCSHSSLVMGRSLCTSAM